MEIIKKLNLCTIHQNGTVTLVQFDVNKYNLKDDVCSIIVDGDTKVSAKIMSADEFRDYKKNIEGDGDPNQIELNLGETNA